jgi:hypothetical protein
LGLFIAARIAKTKFSDQLNPKVLAVIRKHQDKTSVIDN